MEKNKFISIVLFFAATIWPMFCLPQKINAVAVPIIYVTDVEVVSIDNGHIKGEFVVSNREFEFSGSISCDIELFKKNSGGEAGEFISHQLTKPFFIEPRGEVRQGFDYAFPSAIPAGDYILRVQGFMPVTGNLGWMDKEVHLSGSGNFLRILSDISKVKAGGKEYNVSEGANVNSKDKVTAGLRIKNLSEAKDVVAHIKIYDRQIDMDVLKEYDDAQKIHFSKGETKDLEITMPQFDKPASYLAEIFFADSKGVQVSGEQFIRWVVKGLGGKIFSVKLDKDYYSKGETVSVKVDTIGSADGSTSGPGEVSVSVFDNKGTLVGQATKSVKLSDLDSVNFEIPVISDFISPSVKAELKREGVVLDKFNMSLPLSVVAENFLKDAPKREMLRKIFLLSEILVFVLAVVFIIFALRSLTGAKARKK